MAGLSKTTTLKAPPELFSANESKRLRACEGLVVVVIVVASVLVLASTFMIALYLRMGDVTGALPPGQ